MKTTIVKNIIKI